MQITNLEELLQALGVKKVFKRNMMNKQKIE